MRVPLLANMAMWIVCILFPTRSSIIMLTVGFLIYLILIPIAESAEQTVIQRVVPLATQGRVFGFAQSLETAADALPGVHQPVRPLRPRHPRSRPGF